MREPLAYFITFRTYATWLPGDDRGWVDRRRNGYGDAPEAPRPRLADERTEHLRAGPLVLTPQMRQSVDAAIVEVCTRREWRLAACNVRSNHVHVVVSGSASPARVMNDLKVWSTRELRTLGLVEANRPVWARHGSTRFIYDEEGLAEACRYVVEFQDQARFAE